ncbi:hypothetical protein GCM10029976_047580 [Kribbella albertanoniae]|uniref:DUF320 domain-containing protein n=1 Tax=Kribbella albertanoniae TaxID=1266829 RepID=A0A4V2XRG2_9ACTN|nr:hypothetical protein [Kribbella albertanoniae]TDC29725.1 hypothetical protein E1261_15005 [Kribbella albertanoniae]
MKNLTRLILGGLATAALGAFAAAALSAPTVANAGLVDGSLNDANVLSGSNVLGALLNSQLGNQSNNNANTRAESVSLGVHL